MNWKFWQKNEEASNITEDVQEEMIGLRSDIDDLQTQMKKMVRLQMRASKSTEDQMTHLTSTITSQKEQQASLDTYEESQQLIKLKLLQLLDDIDHVSSGLDENDRVWRQLLDQWAEMLVQSLELTDMFQIKILGKSFNPKLAEAIQTVERNELPVSPIVPYQVIEVMQRGFVTGDHQLIRKAKVITVKEEKEHA